MSLKDLEPGRYKAMIADHGLTLVEKIDAVKAFIKMNIVEVPGNVSGYFECFAKKKDGTANDKLVKTLVTCGFKSDDLKDLNNQGALDMLKVYDVTVVKDGEYTRIEWINDPSRSVSSKITDVKKLSGLKFSSEFKEARKEMGLDGIPNRAPEMIAAHLDKDEPLPF